MRFNSLLFSQYYCRLCCECAEIIIIIELWAFYFEAIKLIKNCATKTFELFSCYDTHTARSFITQKWFVFSCLTLCLAYFFLTKYSLSIWFGICTSVQRLEIRIYDESHFQFWIEYTPIPVVNGHLSYITTSIKKKNSTHTR